MTLRVMNDFLRFENKCEKRLCVRGVPRTSTYHYSVLYELRTSLIPGTRYLVCTNKSTPTRRLVQLLLCSRIVHKNCMLVVYSSSTTSVNTWYIVKYFKNLVHLYEYVVGKNLGCWKRRKSTCAVLAVVRALPPTSWLGGNLARSRGLAGAGLGQTCRTCPLPSIMSRNNRGDAVGSSIRPHTYDRGCGGWCYINY